MFLCCTKLELQFIDLYQYLDMSNNILAQPIWECILSPCFQRTIFKRVTNWTYFLYTEILLSRIHLWWNLWPSHFEPVNVKFMFTTNGFWIALTSWIRCGARYKTVVVRMYVLRFCAKVTVTAISIVPHITSLAHIQMYPSISTSERYRCRKSYAVAVKEPSSVS